MAVTGMRDVRVAGLRFVSTPIPAGSELVRVFFGEGRQYQRMTVASPDEVRRVLTLSGWLLDPLKRSEYRAAKDALYPGMQQIEWDRFLDDGSFSRRSAALHKTEVA